jgi:isopentenyl-diphosphate delta-isomerase type 1
MDEYLDIVDEKGNVIGKDTRSNLHKCPNKVHRTTNILILNSKGQILIQQRSFKKEFGPGIWEISAGGHVTSGDTPDKTAQKELFEELGIKVPLEFIAKKVFKFERESELAHLYIGHSDGPFKIDHNEIERVRFIDFDKVEEFLKKDNNMESMLGLWLPTIKKYLIK